MKKTYVLYDERARTMDTDDASVLDTADTKPKSNPPEGIWAEYDLEDGVAKNENLLWELPTKEEK